MQNLIRMIQENEIANGRIMRNNSYNRRMKCIQIIQPKTVCKSRTEYGIHGKF